MVKEVKGIIVALITPFTEKGEIYSEGLRNIVEWVEEGGVHGIFPNSSTGEALRMNSEERVQVASKVIEYASSKVMVTPGVSGNTVDQVVEEAKKIEDLDADALVVIPPYYYRLSKEALECFYSSVISRVNIPIILYNIPSASCNWLEVDLVEKLASTGRVLGIKDSSGNLDYTRLLIKRVGGKISVMQGSELLLLPTLVFGGRGGVLGTANLVPKLFVNLYNSYIKGDMSSAVKLQKLAYKVLDVIYRGSADTFFYNVKYALRKLGVDVGYPRKPYREPSKEEAKEIDNLLNWLKEEKLV